MSTELGLDPSDPLSLILKNGDSSSDESSQNDSPQHDWSKFGALWADGAEQSSLKPYSDIMDLSDLAHMSMDMDFNSSMAIEPSALHHFPGSTMNFSYDDQFNPELLSTQFPFMFQFGATGDLTSSSSSTSPQLFPKERRLSTTSSSSSSGASLSPVPESLASPVPGYVSDTAPPKEEPIQQSEMPSVYANDPAAELAQRVRQSAGVMLAVPMNAQLQAHGVTVPMPNPSQSKPPIARFQHQNSPPKSSSSSSSSAASTPPPSTPPLTSTVPFRLSVNTTAPPPTANMASTPTVATPTSALPRPKTSHTTIERRYRTNLNARIQSLRMAVPALRVLEDREGGNGKKIKKNVKGNVLIKGSGNVVIEGEDGTVVDIIDERGFVDGVKVARKCSKANVLGKAVEYIRVLKKREQRLKAEQAGLKTLVSGLVGGPALVREWEKEWKAKFGGEEKDEVEGEDEEGDEEDSEDEDGDDGDDEPGKKRKRAKLSTSALPVKKPVEKKKPAPVLLIPGNDTGIPEKRKRGRPRKVLPPPVAFAGEQDEVMQPPTPFTVAQHQQLHEWAAQQQQQQQPQPQQFLLAVFALFSFFNSSFTSSWSTSSSSHGPHTGVVLSAAHPPLAYAPDIISQFAAPQLSVAPVGWDWKEYVQLFHLLVSLLVLASFICNWLGLTFGLEIGKVFGKGQSFRQSVTAAAKRRQNMPRSWAKMGEESVLQGQASTLSLYERLQVYRSVKVDASVSDLTTLALVVASTTGALGGLARIKARFIWDAAKNAQAKISESLVFETMDMDEAALLLSKATPSDGTEYTPVEVLGVVVVKERVKKHLAKLFAGVVDDDAMEDNEEEEEDQRSKTVEAARELGGQVAELGRMFERVWKSTSGVDGLFSFDPEEAGAGVDSEIRALLVALSLYRQLFPDAHKDVCGFHSSSALLSPPPSPSSKASVERGNMLLSLRKALGSRVFEDEVMCLEDARDRVVDMIVDADRRQRGSPTP